MSSSSNRQQFVDPSAASNQNKTPHENLCQAVELAMLYVDSGGRAGIPGPENGCTASALYQSPGPLSLLISACVPGETQ